MANSTAMQDPQAASHEQLIETIKNMQRQDPLAKGQWAAYVNSHGSMMRDPSKHTAEFLQLFLMQYKSGVRLPENDEGAGSTAELIKLAQARSTHWRKIWGDFCLQHSAGRSDPSTHDASSLFKFLDYIAELAAHAVSGGHDAPGQQQHQQQAGLNGGMSGGCMAKRLRDDGFNVGLPGVNVDPNKESLVIQVKHYQRQGDGHKEAWSSFCDAHLGGIKDPNRHDVATLAHFLQAQGVTPIVQLDAAGAEGAGKRMRRGSLGSFGLPAGGSQGAFDPLKDKLVGQVKAFQRLGDQQKEMWATWCDANVNGIRDPNRQSVDILQQFVVAHRVPDNLGGAPATEPGVDPAKDVLVNQIKRFQRQGDAAKFAWATFCDTHLAGVKDPSRHDVTTLQEFVATHVQQTAAVPIDYGAHVGGNTLADEIDEKQRTRRD